MHNALIIIFLMFLLIMMGVFLQLQNTRVPENARHYTMDPGSVKVYTSVYIKDIKTYDLSEGTYTVSFYLTFMRNKADQNFNATILPEIDNKWEFVNGEINYDTGGLNYSVHDTLMDENGNPDPNGNYNGSIYLVYATFNSKIDLHKYPFDSQVLTIKIENLDEEKNDLEYIPNPHCSGLGSSVYVNGYSIYEWREYSSVDNVVAWGSYSQYNFEIVVIHENSVIYKILLPIIFLFLSSFLVNFISPTDIASRLALIFTIILGSISHYMSVASVLPSTGYMTVFDVITTNSYFIISIFLLWSVILVNKMPKKGRSDKVDDKKGARPEPDIDKKYTHYVDIAALVFSSIVFLSCLF